MTAPFGSPRLHHRISATNPMANLLLVDDDPGTLSVFEALLRLAGYGVVAASSGEEALDLLRKHSVDLIVCDLRLPDMSGLAIPITCTAPAVRFRSS